MSMFLPLIYTEIYKLCNNLGGVDRFLGTISLVVVEQPPLSVSSGYLESLRMDRHVILCTAFSKHSYLWLAQRCRRLQTDSLISALFLAFLNISLNHRLFLSIFSVETFFQYKKKYYYPSYPKSWLTNDRLRLVLAPADSLQCH